MSNWNENIIKEFRENKGKVSGKFDNVTLALLHTIGAKSGETRINPLICLPDDNRYLVVASKGGASTHPDWYHNILANPDVTVEFGTNKFEATAIPAEEPERTDLYTKMESFFNGFSEYKTMTERVIPIVVLQPK